MIVEIKLENKNSCDGCPLMGWSDISSDVWCSVDGGMSDDGVDRGKDYIVRPEQCKIKYGE